MKTLILTGLLALLATPALAQTTKPVKLVLGSGTTIVEYKDAVAAVSLDGLRVYVDGRKVDVAVTDRVCSDVPQPDKTLMTYCTFRLSLLGLVTGKVTDWKVVRVVKAEDGEIEFPYDVPYCIRQIGPVAPPHNVRVTP